MEQVPNALNWFEIPVRDMRRAKKFYESILGLKLTDLEIGGAHMAMWPFTPNTVAGALVKSKGYVPSKRGTLVYLNAGADLNKPLKKVTRAGGAVLMEKMSIGENGFIAYFEDTEGNKVALHSMK